MTKIGQAAFTYKSKAIANALFSHIFVSEASEEEDLRKRPKLHPFEGLWDTGATDTVISQKVVSVCDLKPVSRRKMQTPNGVKETYTYLIDVMLPNNVMIPGILALEGDMGEIDMLIGMDVINLGDFAVTNFEKQTTFSFRIPSKQRIDFVAAGKVPQYEACPCGSGKKHKKCCGKPAK